MYEPEAFEGRRVADILHKLWEHLLRYHNLRGVDECRVRFHQEGHRHFWLQVFEGFVSHDKRPRRADIDHDRSNCIFTHRHGKPVYGLPQHWRKIQVLQCCAIQVEATMVCIWEVMIRFSCAWQEKKNSS